MSADGNLLPRYILMQKALFSSLHLKDALDAAVVQFADFCGGARVAIFLSDNESLALKLMASKGYSDSSIESLKVVPFAAESLLKYVVQKRMPFSIGPGDTAPDVSASIMRREGSVAQFALPLIASNLLVGAVLVDLQEPSPISQIDFFREVADLVAMAIANSILFGRSEYERERLGTLYKTSCALSGSVLSVPEVLQIASDTALVLGNTPNCAILLYDPARRAFNLAAFKGLEGSSLNDFDLSVDGTIAGRCLTGGKTEYVHDATAHMYGLPRSTGGSILGSLVALPMVQDHEPIGVVMVFSTDARAFHREQIELLESLVHQVTIALNVALTHESATSQSIQDAHTGLYNRWHFEDSLIKEIERSQRHKRELSLMLIDVDHLAHINDHLGQEKGDEAIRHVARLIKGSLRDIDIPCRYGGEEFAVLLPETPLTAAAEVADRLRQRIRTEAAPGIGMVTVSVGLSAYPQTAHDADELLRTAEQALDVAKFEGRDRVKVTLAGQPTAGQISWEELARQAKLSVISERQSNIKPRLEVAPEYASWMRTARKKPGGE
jgi:diguanylate cyclase (GGDEF)-like protein